MNYFDLRNNTWPNDRLSGAWHWPETGEIQNLAGYHLINVNATLPRDAYTFQADVVVGRNGHPVAAWIKGNYSIKPATCKTVSTAAKKSLWLGDRSEPRDGRGRAPLTVG